ncbi:ATP-binding protein, partial [Bifidobacterium sp. UBA6881]|uniref:ATP-binding protein n=1 Tax=Bifidobacterium sp. UBA6881 TaxID=1946109 RepID=UPI0032E3FCD0
MMLRRKALERLAAWKRGKTTQALLVDGARQVGKTTVIEEFGRTYYEHLVELNFIDNPEALSAVQKANTADDLFMAIAAFAQDELIPGKTLVFLDEVQACPDVVTMVKFLVQRYGQYDYVFSGSLLGTGLRGIRSVPVGFLDSFTMYPLDFEEYCMARSVSNQALEEVADAFRNRRQVNPAIHQRMTDLFHEYLIVGGMPAAVDAFVKTHNVQQLRLQQQSIVDQYRRDISQYADNLADARAIRRIFDLVPAELSQQNKRFRITQVSKGTRLSREEDRFLWLADAGVALPVYNVDEPRYPLMLSMNSRLFKLFLNDVGLLTCMCGMDVIRDLLNDRTDINYGALYENAIAQELKAHGFNLFYYKNNS